MSFQKVSFNLQVNGNKCTMYITTKPQKIVSNKVKVVCVLVGVGMNDAELNLETREMRILAGLNFKVCAYEFGKPAKIFKEFKVPAFTVNQIKGYLT